jgi:alpha-aminoadipic semialdehyde synthase
MKGLVGIRREDKNRWERRVPLTPDHVRKLMRREDVGFVVQPSPLRVFADAEYEAAGARIDDDLSACNVVMGVKEIPAGLLEAGRAYLFFSHTIKAQPYNMPMLGRMLELGCTLLDYELIVDEQGRRTVFFGVHAGLAGMGETLVALGRRLALEGIETPLSELRPPHACADLASFEDTVARAGERIAAEGLDERVAPLVFGITGYGNVSRGAQHVLDLLPTIEIEPDALPELRQRPDASRRHVYKTVFREEHMVEPLEGEFRLQDYYDRPEGYRSVFQRYLPHLDVLVNCIFWTERYPRLVTFEQAARLQVGDAPRLRVIGDISCDVGGAVELTVRCTMPGEPCFTIDPETGETTDGVTGGGITVMAVDNLPCELSREASASFGEALVDLVGPLARADWSRDLDAVGLPRALADAVIVHRGRLTGRFAFLDEHIRKD